MAGWSSSQRQECRLALGSSVRADCPKLITISKLTPHPTLRGSLSQRRGMLRKTSGRHNCRLFRRHSIPRRTNKVTQRESERGQRNYAKASPSRQVEAERAEV